MCVMVETARGGGYLYEEGLVKSPDGYVRAFDAKAGGTVFSDGAAALLLKRLDDAVADGDDIYAVIKGFSTNNDGMAKGSFSGPSVDGQVEVIRSALYMAEIEPESMGRGLEILQHHSDENRNLGITGKHVLMLSGNAPLPLFLLNKGFN